MCYRHVRAIIEADISPPTAKLIAIIIAEHADDGGWTWVSQRVIAEETGCPERTVRYHMKALRAAGVITKKDGRTLQVNRQPIAALENEETGNPLPKTGNPLPKNRQPIAAPIKEPSEPSLKGQKTRAKKIPDHWQSEEDGQAGMEAADILENLGQQIDNANAVHDAAQIALVEAGFDVSREFRLPRYDGERNGRLDLMARKYGGSVAIEIDARSVRERSIAKLESWQGFRLAALRGVQSEPIDGIDRCVRIRIQLAPKRKKIAGDPAEFDEFWKAYPRKVAKAAGQKAYGRAVQKAPHAEIMAGVRRLAVKAKTMEAQFVPHASTWLNGERWGDIEADFAPKSTTDDFFDEANEKIARMRAGDTSGAGYEGRALHEGFATDRRELPPPGQRATEGVPGGRGSGHVGLSGVRGPIIDGSATWDCDEMQVSAEHRGDQGFSDSQMRAGAGEGPSPACIAAAGKKV